MGGSFVTYLFSFILRISSIQSFPTVSSYMFGASVLYASEGWMMLDEIPYSQRLCTAMPWLTPVTNHEMYSFD